MFVRFTGEALCLGGACGFYSLRWDATVSGGKLRKSDAPANSDSIQKVRTCERKRREIPEIPKVLCVVPLSKTLPKTNGCRDNIISFLALCLLPLQKSAPCDTDSYRFFSCDKFQGNELRGSLIVRLVIGLEMPSTRASFKRLWEQRSALRFLFSSVEFLNFSLLSRAVLPGSWSEIPNIRYVFRVERGSQGEPFLFLREIIKLAPDYLSHQGGLHFAFCGHS